MSLKKQRELLKQLKHDGREPASAMKVINELFKRGDIVRADTLKPPSKESATAASTYSLSSVRASLSSYIWGSGKPSAPGLDDPIVPVEALKAAAARAAALSGPMATADIHTVKTFAAAVNNGCKRDAEAVIAHLVTEGGAAALFTDSTEESPEPVLGVRLGRGHASPSDKGVLHTKAALERMEDKESHLTVAIDAERDAAKAAAKAGNKAEALNRLRKKKVLESKLASTRSAATKLSDVLMAVDEAESNRDALVALETGISSLKVATDGGVTADRIDSVAADFDEMMAAQDDARMAFEQITADSAGNEAVLEAELDALMEKKAEDEEGADGKPYENKLPDALEDELAKLVAELPTPTPYESATAVEGAEDGSSSSKAQEEGAGEGSEATKGVVALPS